ncbi:MAG: hypothetical protein M3081_12175 [Gemmatimonadota bacterium]|nr:hypothetical protein [Gemmatimonadota bacterium]
MFVNLALRNLTHRPSRSALLLGGYGLGVGVMIVLLAIGEALLTQARDEKLVGGGAVTVLPEGLDIEVMKTGGVGGLFFSIDRAKFIYRQLLASPRLAGVVSSAAPQIDGKLLYLRAANREWPVRASGEIPSRSARVGAAPTVVEGNWTDDQSDRRWMTPTPLELYSEIDRFHVPPEDLDNRDSWGEWHYFNVLSPDRARWAFISFIVGGDASRGPSADSVWGGQIAISVREQGGATRKFVAQSPAHAVRFSTSSADLTIGASTVTVLGDGRYSLHAVAREEKTGAPLALDLVVSPAARAFFPGAALSSGAFTSGYTVPGLRASATGTLCIASSCERYEAAQSYHDHNWGVWRGVSWEWGASRAGDFTFLYGRVRSPDGSTAAAPLFLYLVDSLGFRSLFRPKQISYVDGRTITVNGATVRVPSHAVMEDARGADTLRVELEIEDAIGTDTRRPLIERGDASAARALRTPYFIQMKGTATLSGRIAGERVHGAGTGFFETYR